MEDLGLNTQKFDFSAIWTNSVRTNELLRHHFLIFTLFMTSYIPSSLGLMLKEKHKCGNSEEIG